MNVTPSQIDILDAAMRASSLRQKVIAQNIANVNTPGYQRLDVDFQRALSKALESSRVGDLPEPKVILGEPTGERLDGNTVGIEAETGKASENELFYSAASQLLARQISMLRAAISGRS